MRKNLNLGLALFSAAGMAASLFAANDNANNGRTYVVDPTGGVPVEGSFVVDGAADEAGLVKGHRVARQMPWPDGQNEALARALDGDDSAYREMMARLAARPVALSQDPATQNYYFVDGVLIALRLDPTRIAVKMGANVPAGAAEAAAGAAAARAGAATTGHTMTGDGLVFVKLAQPARDLADARAKIEAVLGNAGVEFASPVFSAPLHENIGDGGFFVPTQRVMVRVAPEFRADMAMALAKGAPDMAVAQAPFGSFEGGAILRSAHRNGFDVLAQANRMAIDATFEWSEPDAFVSMKMNLEPDDPEYADQWGMHDADGNINAEAAWNITTGHSTITTLVTDEGCQTNHPDLNWANGRDFTTGAAGGVGDGAPSNSCENHGTAVSGCISAITNNGNDCAGVAGGSRIMNAKIADNNPCGNPWEGFSHSWNVNAINWGVTQGSRQHNMSWSSGSVSAALNTAIDDSYSNNNMLHFAAAGNDSDPNLNYPASAAFVISVAAMNSAGNRAGFSNWGTGLDISAPGDDIRTLDRTGANGYAGGDVAWVDGTSFASPYAAGVAALHRSQFPNATVGQSSNATRFASVDLGAAGYDTDFGYGFVNAYNTLTYYNPSNDFCSGATAIAGTSYNPAVVSTVWATQRSQEPQADCEAGAAGESYSVFYTYTAPSTGLLSVNTNGSDYDTVLSLYGSCGFFLFPSGAYLAPSVVACDDDGGAGLQSQLVNIPMYIGQTYKIKVSDYGTAPGGGGDLDFNLSFAAAPPSNDTCPNAIDIPSAFGFYGNIQGTDTATTATCEGGTTCGATSNSNSVWYDFTAPDHGFLSIDTEGSDFDTVIHVLGPSLFGGCPFSINGNCFSNPMIACDDDGGTGLLSVVTGVELAANQRVLIRVDDYNAPGGGRLDFNLNFDEYVPPNDNCADATVMPAGYGTFDPALLDARNATGEACENTQSCGLSGNNSSVWYRFTPSASGYLTLNTAGSDYDTVVSVNQGGCATGSCTQGGPQIACNDDSNGTLQSEIFNLPVNAGTTYTIKVSDYGASVNPGWLDFNAVFTPTPQCDSIDFNNDGLFPDNQDLEDFLNVFGGGACSTGNCNDIDFNNDGLFPDNQDLQAFFDVFGGGACS
ncbi:MAG TPA: S8 family serine peptidase [Phycisphaerales bacterium]|nr:S8 family serine peptidase [Phycisphaerales bacterium]